MISSRRVSPHNVSYEEALTLSIREKQEYFDGVILQHPKLNQVFREVSSMVQPNSGTDIVCLIGPTGVGKTALVNHLKQNFLVNYGKEMDTDRGFLPIVAFEVPTSGEKRFSWRMFYSEWGSAFSEPLMDQKQETIIEEGRIKIRRVENGTTVAAMRNAIVGTLIARKTIVVVMDEANHIFCTMKGPMLNTAVHALKSFANMTGITLILVGSYDLYPIVALSGQISRRSAIVHFKRYEIGNIQEEWQFAGMLNKLQEFLPIEDRPDLMPYSRNLHLASAGCVGILKTILARALNSALEAGSWKECHLESALLSEGQLEKILEEILEGEINISKNVYGFSSFNKINDMTQNITREVNRRGPEATR